MGVTVLTIRTIREKQDSNSHCVITVDHEILLESSQIVASQKAEDVCVSYSIATNSIVTVH